MTSAVFVPERFTGLLSMGSLTTMDLQTHVAVADLAAWLIQ